MTNAMVKNDQPIPDINTDSKPDINTDINTDIGTKKKSSKKPIKKLTDYPDDFKPTDKQVAKMNEYGINIPLFLETFDSNSEITSHYDGCGCYFSTTKDGFIAGNKNVFYGTILGEESSEIELIIEGKIEKLLFKEKQKVGLDNYYKYANSKHIASIKLVEEDIEAEEGVFLSGEIIVDKKYISRLFGICGC